MTWREKERMRISNSLYSEYFYLADLSLFFWLTDLTTSHCNRSHCHSLTQFFTPTHHSLRFGSHQNLGNHSKLTVFWSHIVNSTRVFSPICMQTGLLLFNILLSVVLVWLLSFSLFNDKAIMCRDLRRNVFFHRQWKIASSRKLRRW